MICLFTHKYIIYSFQFYALIYEIQSVAAELMHDMIHADFWQPLQLFLFDIIERTSSREKHVPSDTDHCTCTSQ